MSSLKQISKTQKKAVATGLLVAVLLLPFKAKAESIEGTGLKKEISMQMFYQARKGDGHEAGAGLDAALGLKPVTLGVSLGMAGNLETGATSLETAGVNLTVAPFPVIGITGYAQKSRFLGGQAAAGGVLHANLNSITLHGGAERDLVTQVTPLFIGADAELGQIAVSPTLIFPIVPGQNHLNTGGTIKITWKTKITNFFARAFGMMEPEHKQLLAGNVQVGIEIPVK